MNNDPEFWYEDPEWLKYAEHALTEMVPKMQESSVCIQLVPRGETDMKFALELGMSIMLDKPILAVIQPGTQVPAKLVAVADRIMEGTMSDKKFQKRLMATVKEMLGRDE